MSASSVTLFAYLMVFAGEALVVSPWLERVAGRYWWAAAVAFVTALWIAGAAIAA